MAEPIADASTLFFPPLQPAADATLLSGGGVFLAHSGRDGPDGLGGDRGAKANIAVAPPQEGA